MLHHNKITQDRPLVCGARMKAGNMQHDNIPAVAVPVAGVAPVSSAVLEHEAVNGVACFENGHRGAQLTVPHSVMQALIALEHQTIVLQDLETLLQGQ